MSSSRTCTIKHHMPFVPCKNNVIYSIPLSCGKVCVGQTVRCLNIRLHEHHSSLKGVLFSHLSAHCAACGCTPEFCRTTTVYGRTDSRIREIAEAFAICKNGDTCVSAPSIALLDCELTYLKKT
uniref:Tick transposon n=1 Tax=Rhipicephalus appendiculatus TaxID=34631 RepID=A0A131Z0E1_RHIAP